MKKFLKVVLLIINIVTFVFVFVFGLSGIIYDLLGPATYVKMLQALKIPWSFEQIWVFMFACLVLMILSYFLRKKFF